jgi:hypothetical protein
MVKRTTGQIQQKKKIHLGINHMNAIQFFGGALLSMPIMCIADSINYMRAATIISYRSNEVIYRYVRLYEDPCIYIDTLAPRKNWEIISTKTVCAYEGKDFNQGYAFAEPSDLNIRDGIFEFKLKLVTLPPVETKKLKCQIKLDNKGNPPLKCTPQIL